MCDRQTCHDYSADNDNPRISLRTAEVLAGSKVSADQSLPILLHSLSNIDLFHKGATMSHPYLTATAMLPIGLIGNGLAPGNIPLLRTRAPFCITPAGTKNKKKKKKKFFFPFLQS